MSELSSCCISYENSILLSKFAVKFLIFPSRLMLLVFPFICTFNSFCLLHLVWQCIIPEPKNEPLLELLTQHVACGEFGSDLDLWQKDLPHQVGGWFSLINSQNWQCPALVCLHAHAVGWRDLSINDTWQIILFQFSCFYSRTVCNWQSHTIL